MRRIPTMLAVLTFTFTAGAMTGQAASAQGIGGRERAREVLPPEIFERVEEITAGAAREGLPVEPLWDKALEGAAKRVPAPRIPPALTEYVGRLTSARGALGADLPPGALVAAADALRRGVPPGALAQVREGARTSMAVVVLGDLVEAGVPADRAVDVVRAALERRTADQDMLALTARVRAVMRDGRSADAAADVVRRAIREGRSRRPPAADPSRPPTPPGSEPISRDQQRPRGGG